MEQPAIRGFRKEVRQGDVALDGEPGRPTGGQQAGVAAEREGQVQVVDRGDEQRKGRWRRQVGHRRVQAIKCREGGQRVRHGRPIVLHECPGREPPPVDLVRPGRYERARPHDRGTGRCERIAEGDFAVEPWPGVAPDPCREGRDPDHDRRRGEVDDDIAAVLQDSRLVHGELVRGAECDRGVDG